MESWIIDLRYAARRLTSRPLYAALAVLTLALGVGGTAATFSLVRGLLLEPLPYREEQELVSFWNVFDWSEAEFMHFNRTFPGFAKASAYRKAGHSAPTASRPPTRRRRSSAAASFPSAAPRAPCSR